VVLCGILEIFHHLRRTDINTTTANGIISKFDSNGNYISTFKIGTFNDLTTMKIDSLNNFIILSLDTSNLKTITKLDSDYSIIFNNNYDTDSVNPSSSSTYDKVVIDTSDNYYVATQTRNTEGTYLKTVTLTRTDYGPIMILFTSSGILEWKNKYLYSSTTHVNYPSLTIDLNNNLLLYTCLTYIEDYRSEGSTNIISDYFYSLIVSINPNTVSINYEKLLESNSCIGQVKADLVNGNFAILRSVSSDPRSHSVHLFDSNGDQIFESSGILGLTSSIQSIISFKQDGSIYYVSYIFNDSGDALYDEYLIDGVIATASSSVIIHKFDISGNKSI